MNKMKRATWALGLVCGLAATARADLYQAQAAVKANDLTRSFELYRELAELGHPEAQENLAVQYVNGEGVKRDNVLGYAWAKIALENGSTGEAAKGIVAQLESRLGDAARARAAEVQKHFGKEALQATLLPNPDPPAPEPSASRCSMKSAADPDMYYPLNAKRNNVWGDVLVDVWVQPDGSVRLPRTRYSFPAEVFEEAGRAVALNSRYTPKIENGVPVACSIAFKVKFRIITSGASDPLPAQLKIVEALRTAARAGDPNSQLMFDIATSLRSEFQKPEDNDIKWKLRSAQAGVPAAQFLIGVQLLGARDTPGNEAKALRWLEMAAKGGNAPAMTALASYWLAKPASEDTRRRGYEWLEKAGSTQHREGRYLFAAMLAGGPDPARRDYARALDIMKDIGDSFDYDPLSFEVRAAALAGRGDYPAAVRAQERALKIAKKLDWDVSEQQARLLAYAAGRPAEGELVRF